MRMWGEHEQGIHCSIKLSYHKQGNKCAVKYLQQVCTVNGLSYQNQNVCPGMDLFHLHLIMFHHVEVVQLHHSQVHLAIIPHTSLNLHVVSSPGPA